MLLIRKNLYLFRQGLHHFPDSSCDASQSSFEDIATLIQGLAQNLLMTRSRGWVWTHFIPESYSPRNGTCTFCEIAYKGGKTNRMLVHHARACDKISAEVKWDALSRLPATEILPNESASSECCVGESDTITICIAELLVVDNHSYREDRAMMTLIQLMTEKWKPLLEFY